MSGELIASDLELAYANRVASRTVVGPVNLVLERNRIVGLAGESGCGKSTLSLALAGYRAPGAVVLEGSVDHGGVNLSGASIKELRRVWGARIAYMPQDTSTALNPALTVGTQLAEPLRVHLRLGRRAAAQRAVELLERVEIPEPARALGRYPHQFSGGQQQRIALAIGLSCEPEVLILDEPTTGLDVTTSARMNELILSLARQHGMATLYVSHNLALLATVCDDLAIMYGGEIVEMGRAADVYLAPRHPYTAALLAAVPSIEAARRPVGIPGMPPASVATDTCGFAPRCAAVGPDCGQHIPLARVAPNRDVRCIRVARGEAVDRVAVRGTQHREHAAGRGATLLEVSGLRCAFRHRGHETVAVEDASLRLGRGETLGIAGESGSGKSTLLRAIVGLIRPSAGEIRLAGAPLAPSAGARPGEVRRAIQIVFQNPDATLNPRHTVFAALERPLKLFRPDVAPRERRDVAADMLQRMLLSPSMLDRYPRHLSGGQRQRVALARALVAEPQLVLCDEITSALDVSVQATVLELLIRLREEQGLSLVFVTHDLGVLRSIADEAIVMERGAIRESGPIADVLMQPEHAYTRALLESVPDPARARNYLERGSTA